MRRKGWREAKQQQKQRQMAVNTIATPPQSPDRKMIRKYKKGQYVSDLTRKR